MRSYLYLWNEPAKRRFITSGIEFKDLLPALASGGGIYLLRHKWDGDTHQGFDFISASDLHALDIAIAGLGNRFLGFGHDDGWRLILWYTEWRHMEHVLTAVVAPASLDAIRGELRDGSCGFWLEEGRIEKEEMTLDIDGLLNRRFPT